MTSDPKIVPNCVLMFHDGDLACDPDLGEGSLMAFTSMAHGKAYRPLCKQKSELTVMPMGEDELRSLVRRTPQVWAVSVVYDLGPERRDPAGKLQRAVHKVSFKRAAFLSGMAVVLNSKGRSV